MNTFQKHKIERSSPRPVPHSTMRGISNYSQKHQPRCEIACCDNRARTYLAPYDAWMCREHANNAYGPFPDWPDEVVQELERIFH